MKFYLAAIYQRREELQGYMRRLEAAGHEVTSRWLKEDFDDTDWYNQAFVDCCDIAMCDLFIVFTEDKGYVGRGGKDFETGLAMGMAKPLLLIGPVQHQFYSLLESNTPDFDTFMEQLLNGNIVVVSADIALIGDTAFIDPMSPKTGQWSMDDWFDGAK